MDVYQVENIDGGGEAGTIEYDPDAKAVAINLAVPAAKRKELELFFSTPREFMTPEDEDVIDGVRVDVVAPVDHPGYFRMAMSELYGATGVWVYW